MIPLLAWFLAAVLLVTAAVLLLHGDRPGTLLSVLAMLAAAAAGYYTSVARPRLAAGETGLRIRTLSGSYEFDWDEVDVHTAAAQRLGRTSNTLEIDTGDNPPHLVVFGRLELDAEPPDVIEALQNLRPRR